MADFQSSSNVTYGARCTVHASAHIDATRGPIAIGDDVAIDELVTIRNDSGAPMRIGDGNWFQVGSACFASRVGDYNVFKPRSVVSAGVVVGGCSVGRWRRRPGALADGAAVFRCGDAADARACDHLLELHKVLAAARGSGRTSGMTPVTPLSGFFLHMAPVAVSPTAWDVSAFDLPC
ncbi:ATP binding protein [Aureococcus anophagefferens]|nr:ATP binding protein [Aureococcus anophagefferens]